MSWQITSGIVVDHAHNIYISGSFMGITDFDPGAATYTLSSNSNVESAAFLCKLNADGNFVWAKQMGGTGLDFAGGMSKDDIGNIYLCGIFDGTEDFDPNAGTVTLSTTASSCAFIVKFNSSGNLIWARQTQDVSGSSNSIQGWDIAVDHSGGAYLTGSFAGTFDLDPGAATHTISSGSGSQVYGLKLDSAGNYVWGIAITGTGVSPNSGMSVALDDDGDAYIGGQYNGTVDFDPGTGVHNLTTVMPGYTQSFIVKLSSDSGSFVWVKEFADGNSYVRSLYVEGSEEIIYVTGQLNDVPVDFDPGTGVHTVTSAAWSDAFVCKLGWSVLGNEEQIMLGSDLAVYPNPASNVINIRSLKEITGVDIYDLQGKKLIAGNGNIQSVNISGLSAGTYLVAVRHAEKTRVTKLIVTE
jgi:hypothetical protein